MKTSHKFLAALLALALTGSFLIQDNAENYKLNQAALISFTSGGSASPSPGPEAKTNTAPEISFLLPMVKVDDTLMPNLLLPEVDIDAKYPRENIYPIIKIDGKYMPYILLDEVKIFAL